uniref:Uncharacterized protein n=1 Tax=Arundo donax TaxID=35708 RepID=A0A0A9A7M8_ARUDO
MVHDGIGIIYFTTLISIAKHLPICSISVVLPESS